MILIRYLKAIQSDENSFQVPRHYKTEEISYSPELNQETSYAQAHKQETSIQIELQRNLFEVEHLIYNQWYSQCKSDTDS